jgi:sodium/bile acid cotransporter 7
MITKLGLLVVVPILVAQLTRLHRPIAGWSTRQKVSLSAVAQCGILSIVLVGAVQSAERIANVPAEQAPQWADFVLMILVVAGLHSVVLAAGYLLARSTGLRRPEQIAVAFSGSQKTLMVGIYVATNYFAGLTLLPMVAYHVCQLLIDTLVADRMRSRSADEPQP